MTSPLTEESTQDILNDSDIIHLVCDCDENIALCGVDVSGAFDVESDEDECVVCLDLDEFPCERCGSMPVYCEIDEITGGS